MQQDALICFLADEGVFFRGQARISWRMQLT